METPKQRLEKIYSWYNTNASDIERRHKELHPSSKFTKQTLYNIESGLTKSISGKNALIIKEIFSEIDLGWLTSGNGSMLNSEMSNSSRRLQPGRAGELGLENESNIVKDESYSYYSQNAKQLNEGEDYIWLETSKIPEKAGLALSTNYFADSYVNELEKGKVMVKREHAGKYWEVEATGESMDDGSKRSLLHGDWYAARDVPRDHWKRRLHLNSWNVFYFLHNERGHIIKEVVSHDPETGLIKLTSWNPDKEEYPDFEINIKDCYIVANIVKLVSRNYNIHY